MERYLLFAGWDYYPTGGWDDFQGSFATVEKAEERAKELGKDWHHIIDTTTQKEVP